MADTPAELDELLTKLAATEQDLNNHKLRLADFENARKRLLRDMDIDKKYAAEGLVKELLSALDNLDRALAAAQAAGEKSSLVAGVSATATQFLDVLRRYGVTRIECAAGTGFDPNLHEAVMQQPNNDFEPGAVVQVLEQGYLLHDRVLRPTRVIVASTPPAGGSTD